MRRQWRRGHNHTSNQVIIRSDNVRTFTLTEGGEVWLSVPGLGPGAGVVVPPATAVAPVGTLRVILRGGRVEVHYQVEDTAVRSHRPCGAATVGVDKGYSEVLTDTDGDHHGPELGDLLRSRSDTLKDRDARRATLRSIANQAAQRGQHGKAERIRRNNLGTVKKQRQRRRWEQQVRTVTYRAVNAVVDKAKVIVAEDLSRTFTGRRKRGADTNRRLAAWTKGVTAEALKNVSGREVLRCGWSTRPTPRRSSPVPVSSGSGRGIGCTARIRAGSCGTRRTPVRSPSRTEPPLPTSACTPRTGGGHTTSGGRAIRP